MPQFEEDEDLQLGLSPDETSIDSTALDTTVAVNPGPDNGGLLGTEMEAGLESPAQEAAPSPEPEAELEAQEEAEPEEDDVGVFESIYDVTLGAGLRGAEGFVRDLYGLLDFASGDSLKDLPEERIFGEAATLAGGVVQEFINFGLGFLPVTAGLGKFAKVGKHIDLTKKSARALRIAGRGKQAVGLDWARGFTGGAIVDWSFHEQGEERLSNILTQVPALNNPVTRYLEATDDETEAEARLKQMLEGGILGVGMDLFIAGLKGLKRVRKIREDGGTPKAAAESMDDIHEEVERAALNPSGKDPEPVPAKYESDTPIPEEAAEEVDDVFATLRDLQDASHAPMGDKEIGEFYRDIDALWRTAATIRKNLEKLSGAESQAQLDRLKVLNEQFKKLQKTSNERFATDVEILDLDDVGDEFGDMFDLDDDSFIVPEEEVGRVTLFGEEAEEHLRAPSRKNRSIVSRIKSAILGRHKPEAGEEAFFDHWDVVLNDKQGQSIRKATKGKSQAYFQALMDTGWLALKRGEFGPQHMDDISRTILKGADEEQVRVLREAWEEARRVALESDPKLQDYARRGGDSFSFGSLQEAGFDIEEAADLAEIFEPLRDLNTFLSEMVLSNTRRGATPDPSRLFDIEKLTRRSEEVFDLIEHGHDVVEAIADGFASKHGLVAAQDAFQPSKIRNHSRIGGAESLESRARGARVLQDPDMVETADQLALSPADAGIVDHAIRTDPKNSNKHITNALNRVLNLRQFMGNRGSARLLVALEKVFDRTRSTAPMSADEFAAYEELVNAIDPSNPRTLDAQLLGSADATGSARAIDRGKFYAAQHAMTALSQHVSSMLDELRGNRKGIAAERKGEIVLALKTLNDVADFITRWRSEAGRDLRAAAQPFGVSEATVPGARRGTGPSPLSPAPTGFPGRQELGREGGLQDLVIDAEKREGKGKFRRLLETPEPRQEVQPSILDSKPEVTKVEDEASSVAQATRDLETSDAMEALESIGGERGFDKLMSQILPLAAGGDMAKIVKAARLLNSPVKGGGVFWEYWYNALLSSGRTFMTNFVGTVGYVAARPLEIMLGAAFKGDLNTVSRGASEFAAVGVQLKETWSYFRQALKDGTSLDSRIEGYSGDSPAISTANASLSHHEGTAIGSFINGLGAVVRTPSRLLQATDSAIKQVQYRANFRIDLVDKLVAQGTSPEDAWRQANEVLENSIREGQAYSASMVYREGLAVAEREGIEEGLQDQFARSYLQRNYDVSIGDSSKRALDVARQVTFQKPLQQGTIGKLVSDAARNNWLVRFAVPFVRTPTNLLYTTRDHLNPVPGLRFLYHKVRGTEEALLENVGKKHSQFLQDMASHRPEVRAEAVGKLVTGYTAAFTVMYNYHLGNITGGGPSDKRKRAAWEQAGWQPYSIKVGDSWMSYERLDPVASILGIAADFAEYKALDEDKDEDAIEEFMTALTVAIASNLDNKTYLSGLTDVLSALGDPRNNMSRVLGRYASSAMPVIAGDISRAFDPHEREVKGFLDQLTRRSPLHREGLPLQRNFLGEPMEKTRSAAHSIIGDGPGAEILGMFTPITYSSVSDDSLDNEIKELGYGFSPPPVRRGGINLREIDASDSQDAYDRWMELHGEVEIAGVGLRDALKMLIKTERYRAMSPESTDEVESPRLQALRRIIRRYRERAYKQLQREVPEVRRRVVDRLRARRSAILGVDINISGL